jgi:hypothetical protein
MRRAMLFPMPLLILVMMGIQFLVHSWGTVVSPGLASDPAATKSVTAADPARVIVATAGETRGGDAA